MIHRVPSKGTSPVRGGPSTTTGSAPSKTGVRLIGPSIVSVVRSVVKPSVTSPVSALVIVYFQPDRCQPGFGCGSRPSTKLCGIFSP